MVKNPFFLRITISRRKKNSLKFPLLMKLYAFADGVHVNIYINLQSKICFKVITTFVFFLFFKVHDLEINFVINIWPKHVFNPH